MTAADVLARRAGEPLAALAEAVCQDRETLAGLLVAARAGNAEAFGAIVRRFQHATYQFIVRMVRRPAVAEDIAQDVFIRLWRNLGQIGSAEILPRWLRRVAANAVIDYWRKEESRRKWMERVREHPIARHVMRPSGRLESAEAADLVRCALEAVPPRLRSVLVLRTAENLSYEELADTLGISVGAVRSRLFRARQELYEVLKRKKAADYLAEMYEASSRPEP